MQHSRRLWVAHVAAAGLKAVKAQELKPGRLPEAAPRGRQQPNSPRCHDTVK